MPAEPSRRYRDTYAFGPFAAFRAEEARVLEEEIGRSLPPEYLAFLEVANGGSLEYVIRVPSGEALGFSTLYRLGRDDSDEYGPGTLLGSYRRLPGTVFAEILAAEGLAVRSLLPVARNGGGDQLSLDLSPEGNGRVLAATYGRPGLNGHPAIAVLAADFHAYLDALIIDEETAEWAWDYYVGDAGSEDPWRRAIEEWLDQGHPAWRTRSWAGS
jgi:hypothetical protein